MREQNEFLVGDVAAAIGITRGALMNWAQRGYFGFLDKDREPGEVRQFATHEVGYVAVFSFFASFMQADNAYKIMREFEPGYFQASVSRALEGKRVCIFFKTNPLDGGQVQAEIWSDSDEIEDFEHALRNQRLAFEDSAYMGERVESVEDALRDDAPQRDPDPVCVFYVGPVIANAIRSLSQQKEKGSERSGPLRKKS